jgi:hypothetical protein
VTSWDPEVAAAVKLGAELCWWCDRLLPDAGTIVVTAPQDWVRNKLPRRIFCNREHLDKWLANLSDVRDAELIRAEEVP